jgi:tetratricopeptide (TPR) repeat protein
VDLSDKKYGDADIALGTLLLAKNQTVEGESLLRAGLALNPRSWQGQVELSKLELSHGHLDLALTAAEEAESLAPDQPVVYRLLSLVHLKQKNYSALRSDLDAYIRLDPDSPIGVHAKQLRAQLDNQLAR